MVAMKIVLYNWIWQNECAFMSWREGVLVNLFSKEDEADPENRRGITLLSTVGKAFCRILNNREGTMLEKMKNIDEG